MKLPNMTKRKKSFFLDTIDIVIFGYIFIIAETTKAGLHFLFGLDGCFALFVLPPELD